jgi:hypothetical protein
VCVCVAPTDGGSVEPPMREREIKHDEPRVLQVRILLYCYTVVLLYCCTIILLYYYYKLFKIIFFFFFFFFFFLSFLFISMFSAIYYIFLNLCSIISGGLTPSVWNGTTRRTRLA